MKFGIQQAVDYLFASLCMFTTISMVVYWGYKFSLNEDSSVVTYREFYEQKDDVYPTISMCLENPFVQGHLAEYGVDEASYLDFLKGANFSKEMLDVDFDNVSIDISDYIKGYYFVLRNGTGVKQTTGLTTSFKSTLTLSSFAGFLGYKDRFFKCFALNMAKYHNLRTFQILLSNNIFPNGIRPTTHKFQTYLHLPGQRLLSPDNTKRSIWPPRVYNEHYRTRIMVSGVSTEIKRNKKNNPCNKNWQEWDDRVVRRHKKETKCNNPYQKQNETLPMCDTQALMYRAVFTANEHVIANEMKFDKPCKTMEDVRTEVWEETIKDVENEGTFWFGINFQVNKFKESKQTRYYAIVIFEFKKWVRFSKFHDNS